MSAELPEVQTVLDFWFSATSKKHWFNSTKSFDDKIQTKFESTWQHASENLLDHWKQSPTGALALVIVLDQFPLNMFRGKAKSYSTEQKAIEICHYAISKKFDSKLTKLQLPFLYMPLMHSEKINDQNLCVKLMQDAGLDNNLRYAKHHREIISKFGRFPHRNEALNRISTKEELEYLASPHAFKG